VVVVAAAGEATWATLEAGVTREVAVARAVQELPLHIIASQ
jgi:hypothetical protein